MYVLKNKLNKTKPDNSYPFEVPQTSLEPREHTPLSQDLLLASVLPQQQQHQHQRHAVCGRAVASGDQHGPLGPAAERRAAPQETGPLPRLREGVDRVLPRHRPHPGQEGVQAGVRGLLRVHAQAEAGKCGKEGATSDNLKHGEMNVHS